MPELQAMEQNKDKTHQELMQLIGDEWSTVKKDAAQFELYSSRRRRTRRNATSTSWLI